MGVGGGALQVKIVSVQSFTSVSSVYVSQVTSVYVGGTGRGARQFLTISLPDLVDQCWSLRELRKVPMLVPKCQRYVTEGNQIV